MKRRKATIEELRQRPSVTVAEASELTGYCKNTIYKRIADKVYRASTCGNHIRIVTKDLWDAEERLADQEATKR
ncbi:hypothetical protein EON81_03005 [bacterium]|nr:MAG: hypothetical protein EON81_03005 [bacterium]